MSLRLGVNKSRWHPGCHRCRAFSCSAGTSCSRASPPVTKSSAPCPGAHGAPCSVDCALRAPGPLARTECPLTAGALCGTILPVPRGGDLVAGAVVKTPTLPLSRSIRPARYRPGRWEMFTGRSDQRREHRCKCRRLRKSGWCRGGHDHLAQGESHSHAGGQWCERPACDHHPDHD